MLNGAAVTSRMKCYRSSYFTNGIFSFFLEFRGFFFTDDAVIFIDSRGILSLVWSNAIDWVWTNTQLWMPYTLPQLNFLAEFVPQLTFCGNLVEWKKWKMLNGAAVTSWMKCYRSSYFTNGIFFFLNFAVFLFTDAAVIFIDSRGILSLVRSDAIDWVCTNTQLRVPYTFPQLNWLAEVVPQLTFCGNLVEW